MYIKEHIGQIPPSGLTSCHLYGHYEEVPIFNFILPAKEVHDNIDNALSGGLYCSRDEKAVVHDKI